jgi:hypothetical protein
VLRLQGLQQPPVPQPLPQRLRAEAVRLSRQAVPKRAEQLDVAVDHRQRLDALQSRVQPVLQQRAPAPRPRVRRQLRLLRQLRRHALRACPAEEFER